MWWETVGCFFKKVVCRGWEVGKCMLDDEHELVMMVGMILATEKAVRNAVVCAIGWRINVEMEQEVCCV